MQKIVEFLKISIKIKNCKIFNKTQTVNRLKKFVQFTHPPPHQIEICSIFRRRPTMFADIFTQPYPRSPHHKKPPTVLIHKTILTILRVTNKHCKKLFSKPHGMTKSGQGHLQDLLLWLNFPSACVNHKKKNLKWMIFFLLRWYLSVNFDKNDLLEL